MSEETKPLRKAILAFAGHACTGAVIFVILAMIAFGLGKFVNLLETWGIDPMIAMGLHVFEYLLFAGDAITLGLFVFSAVRAAYREVRE